MLQESGVKVTCHMGMFLDIGSYNYNNIMINNQL